MATHRPRRDDLSDEPEFSLRAGDRSDSFQPTERAVPQELRTSLAIVLGEAQHLLVDSKAPGLETETRQRLEAIYREVQRITGIMKRSRGTADDPAHSAPEPVIDRGPINEETVDQIAGFRTLVESMDQGVMVVDLGRVIGYANPSLATITGAPIEQIVGQHVGAFADSLSPSGRAKAYLERALSEPTDPLEIPLSGGQDRTLWIRLESTPLRPGGGQVQGSLVTVTDVTRQKQSEQAIREAALHDPLTGIPTRALLRERLENALARAKRHRHHQFAVLFLDLDDLKSVNDSLGHSAGDEFLVQVAVRLRACLRPEDTVARIGGDEFAILLEGMGRPADVTRVAERILSEISKPLQLQGLEAVPSASIGIVLSKPTYHRPEQLLSDADTAMYRAKTSGRGRYEIFDRDLQRLSIARLRTEAEMRRALERGELQLHFQPVVALDTRRIVGLEALLRWEHPQRGLLQATDFIAAAEHSSVIVPMGQWALLRACLQLRTWRTLYREHAPDWIAVNLSSRQFFQPGLVAEIREVLQQTSLAPDALRLEIQESTLAGNSRLASEVLTDLRHLGIGINLDAFGTAQSSISGLHEHPIHALKLDRSFFHPTPWDEGQARLVKTVLALAENIGAVAIAEGIHTEEQLIQLQQTGCRFAQGSVISPPLAGAEVERLFRADQNMTS